MGNILTKSDVGTYTYGASGASSVLPHAVASITPSGTGTVNTTYSYDANGNMTSGNGRTITWTPFDKVATIAQGTKLVSFDYDADHARMRQVTSGAGSSATTTLYISDAAAGIMTEKATGATGTVQWNDYLFAGGQMIGVRFKIDNGSSTTVRTRYFTTDNLGSIAVLTDEAGAVAERLSYDAWGKRRNSDGTDATGVTSQTTRGFTGQEMIDDVGLVNMNGRIYDPQIGRFMSADPFIGDPTNGQDLNRYAYVHNNPLSFTDPTGYFSIGSLFKMIVAIVIVVVCIIYAPAIGAFFGVSNAVGAGAIAGAIGGAISAGIMSGGDLRSVLVGAVGGAAFGALGASSAVQSASLGERVMAYGVTGGVTSVMGGGSFQSGFLAAGFGALAGPAVEDLAHGDVVLGTAASGVAGGIGEVLGGGKFENGAISGAFAYAAGRALAGGAEQEQQWDDGKIRVAGNTPDTMNDASSSLDQQMGAHIAKGMLTAQAVKDAWDSGVFGYAAEVVATALPVGKGLRLISKIPGVGLALGSAKQALGPAGKIFGRVRFGGDYVIKVDDGKSLRVGWSWVGPTATGSHVFRIGGDWVARIRPSNPHIDLFKVGPDFFD